MLSYLKFRHELYKLKKISLAMWKKHDDIKDTGNYEEVQCQCEYLGHDAYSVDQEISFQTSEYYKYKANKYLIPIPDEYTTFEFDHGTKKFLTSKGIYSLRKSIREEKKLNREAIGFYITIFTGVLGTVIGLISIAKN